MHISVIGCGYLGATHAACMAELGHHVLGMDADAGRVAALNQAQAPFFERGLDDLIAKHLATGKLRFTTSYADAAEFGDLHFLGVGTPQKPGDMAADLTHLEAAVRRLAVHLTRACVIAGKSTVPVGTAARLTEIFHELAPARDAVEVAWNPEFLRESHAIADTLSPDRLVLGFEDRHSFAEAALRNAYAPLINAGIPLIVTDLATAELVKTAANAFLATKISFINAMAEVCEATGADVHQLADALTRDPRIGALGMRPGLGFGGGCLPKDIRAFMARADELGVDQALTFLREVDAINTRRRSRIVQLAREQHGSTLSGARITIWGAAFKPRTDDIRESPALDVANLLHEAGAVVTVHDPMALDNARKAFPYLNYDDDPADATEGAELLLHLTEWDDYLDVDPERLRARVARPSVIDARGTLDPASWRRAGWTYRALGRP
ncbi:UDP-glucose dehydrogenase family protein [Yinghuangia sp. YIM S09857]|uniref:UDP-glucose dehydrogenase family protein n=1 Tax=Yinghuangia sp. YIM S09857 TaxID=3436929 RepID=UPI003F52BC0E